MEEAPGNNKWLVIVNPNAGRRKGEKDWPGISRLLDEAGFEYHTEFTERRNHAIKITEDHIAGGYRRIIVVGGDGTLNEVVNGVFGQQVVPTDAVTIGMIMLGTGNDWGRMYNIKTKYHKAVKILKKERIFIQDAGKVTYHEGNEQKSRYFVNIAGMGYDALVAEMTNRLKDKGGGGPLSYLANLFKGLFRYKQAQMEIHIDGEHAFQGRVFSMSVGICKYNGGGMMQLPHAVADDGILDMTVFYNATKMDVVKNIKKLYDGSFLELPIVKTFTATKVSVISSPPRNVYLEADGESLGHSPFHFEIIPKSVKIITGKNWQDRSDKKAGS